MWEAQLKADDIYVNGIFKKKSKKLEDDLNEIKGVLIKRENWKGHKR